MGILPDGTDDGQPPQPGQGILAGQGQAQPNASASNGQNPWAPQWVYDQLPTNLAYWSQQNQGADTAGAFAAPGTAAASGQLSPWYNPANWGPPPAANQSTAGGWFPPEFGGGGNQPNGGFWTQAAYGAQFPGGPGAAAGLDQRPNTLNWHLLGNEPGNFMFAGNTISQNKLYNDLHRPVDTQEGGGIVGGSNLYTRQFGPENTAWSTKGQLGLPGQLGPYITMWGAGGP